MTIKEKRTLETKNIENNAQKEINTILNNMKKTGELDGLNQMELIQEKEILIEQLNLKDEYFMDNDFQETNIKETNINKTIDTQNIFNTITKEKELISII